MKMQDGEEPIHAAQRRLAGAVARIEPAADGAAEALRGLGAALRPLVVQLECEDAEFAAWLESECYWQ